MRRFSGSNESDENENDDDDNDNNNDDDDDDDMEKEEAKAVLKSGRSRRGGKAHGQRRRLNAAPSGLGRVWRRGRCCGQQ